ncbi:MAG: FIVAR domain-containing protein, partial [Prevotella sp.]|nr:FIVAR domain-containing protein [Prevotella sp.]
FTASPNSGYKFKNWTKGAGGEVLGTDASINVTCEQNGQYQVYANFEEGAPAATLYNLTLADGSSDHGTVAFTVGGNAATQAKKDDVVTVSVTPNDGYLAEDVTVRAYTSWEAASEILTGGGENPELVSDITVSKNTENGTWTFTMPEANVWVVVTYVVDMTALDDAISEAEAYYNSISESNPDAAAALLEAINTAKGLQNNANVTPEQVETATQTLTDALNAAKADVALKRITLVIPAKSYMARIDADKRQIENAVDGVNLYSVNNVTNTEVELTGELSVIAAEMPYFIYNDNDTEVEVSIVVSSSDADNVDYDSDHFKGTLVDKTFTDEDMQEADHYVLSGGSSFVWVKDAGTLAAGKCWIELILTSAAHARRLSIVHEGETTGINAVSSSADKTDGEWYDLSGRRVAQPAKGIYVKNGRKVIVK